MCCLLPILVAHERRKGVNILAAPQDPHQIPSSPPPPPPAEALVSSSTARRAKRDEIPPMERQRSPLKEALEQPRTKLRDCVYICGGSYITRLKTRWNGLSCPSCLYIMRATFLLPLARMLAAFYRAIKVVNQSLLNDLCFLTCFTGGEGAGTVAAALRTHGSALRGGGGGGGLCNRHNPRLSGL